MKLFSILFTLPTLSLALTRPSETSLEQQTDLLLFSIPLHSFIKSRNAALSAPPQSNTTPPLLDWNSDGCSSSPDYPLHFDFLPACQRHDFGYRNYKNQSRWNEANREKIDNNLLNDLRQVSLVQSGFVAVAYFRYVLLKQITFYFSII